MTVQPAHQGLEGIPRLVSLIWPQREFDRAGDNLAQQLSSRLMDRLNAPWGHGRSMYRAAPFSADAHPSAGWQDMRTPRELTLALLASLDEQGHDQAGKAFADLDETTALAVLHAVMDGNDKRSGRDASVAFQLVRQLVYDALFVDSWEHRALGWEWLDRDARSPAANSAGGN